MIETITAADDPRVQDYVHVAAARALRERGLFVAESRLVVRALVESRRFRVRSVLVTDSAFAALEGILADVAFPVYVAPATVMTGMVGFNVHRGCLALAERPPAMTLDEIAPHGDAVVLALEAAINPDNVGGAFRSALAFGANGVVLGPRSADPLYRKAIRVSIGASLSVPFAITDGFVETVQRLRARGFTAVAFTPRSADTTLDEYVASPTRPRRVLLMFGTEGAGLTDDAAAAADVRVRIPMVEGVDSINLATAVAIGLYRLRESTKDEGQRRKDEVQKTK